MFNPLKRKWNVGTGQLFLILCTFTIGGSLSGYVGRWSLSFSPISSKAIYLLTYMVLVTVIWPAMVLCVSIFFGQFAFFKKYVGNLMRRLSGTTKDNWVIVACLSVMNYYWRHRYPSIPFYKNKPYGMKIKLAIFASGAGSNAQKIIDHFRNRPQAEMALILCNKPGAGVFSIAEAEKIDHLLMDKAQYDTDGYARFLLQKGIDFIVLAGFLRKIPMPLIAAYPKKIVNIHPALLPKFGGKGMYGHFVHEAVIEHKESESGITIHYVDEHYDHGSVIFQAKCAVAADDTPESLSQKIHRLEHEHYPKVIASLISNLHPTS